MNPQPRRRFLLTIHYDGSEFFGWQIQSAERTVQGELEHALERLTGDRRAVLGSGRTDRGVHATGQVASVLLPDRWDAPTLRRALNALLPRSIWVQYVARVPEEFHPRYDALERTYHYLVGTDPVTESPFLRDRCWVLRSPLQADLLQMAAQAVEGEHSFRAFAKAGQEERGDRCHVFRASWTPWEGVGTVFTISANRYLHHMVRYLVGTMVEIAREKRPLDDLGLLLTDRESPLETSPPAPPHGLYLARVRYPAEAVAAVGGDEDGEAGPADLSIIQTMNPVPEESGADS